MVEFRANDRIERLEVKQFTPDWLVVEVRGGWPYPEHEQIPITLEIVEPGGFIEQFRCELTFGGWVSVSGNLDGEHVGKARLLLHCERHERSDLVRLYRQLRFPALVDRGEVDASNVVALLLRSGYLRSRGPSGRPSKAWCAANFPPELGVDTVYCSEDGALIGHVSVTRAYSRTWVGHQLTMLDDHRESAACRVALYNYFATAPILSDAHQQQYLVSYYDRSKPWHQLFFDAFVEWFDEPDQVTRVAFDRFDPIDPINRQSSTADDPTLELDQVRPDELERAVALIREQLPALACAAFDIDAASLDRAYLHPDFAAHGIARGRRAFVVREAGELVGIALCESGSEDLSLNNLFNLAQLYFRPRSSSAAQQALVQFVRSHYRAIGQANPLLVTPAGALDQPVSAGLQLVETLSCVIWQGHALRAYRIFLRSSFERVTKQPEQASQPTSKLDGVYLPRVAEARARLRDDPRLAALRSGALDSTQLLGFLLHFTALNVRAAESAEGQRRAGFVCAAKGRKQLGAELRAAAEHEAVRERVLLEQLFELGQRWQQLVGIRINVELLVNQPPPRSLLRWMSLRERLASGACPAALLAVELERALVLEQLGPSWLEACARLLGEPLRSAGGVFAGDTNTAEAALRQLQAALASEPEAAERIAEAGCESANSYLDLLADCVELGRELAERVERMRIAAVTQVEAANSALRLAFA